MSPHDYGEKNGPDLAAAMRAIKSLNSSGTNPKAEPEPQQPVDAGQQEPESRFRLTDDGVFRKVGRGEEVRIAARLDVVAETRDENGGNWGRLLRWRDSEFRSHEWLMPMELTALDGAGIRSHLLSNGLPFIASDARSRNWLIEYIQTAPTTKRVRCVGRIGWQGDTFVLPFGAIGPSGHEEVLYQAAQDTAHSWNVAGTPEEWRDNVGRFCSGNSRLILPVSCAFAGPLIAHVGSESGGFHFHGATSTGKSTGLIVGGSVLGGGGASGFVQTWRTTVNGLEAMAEAHNDCVLFLDEIAQVKPEDAAETAYLLGNGQGKARMTRNATARRKPKWVLLFVSAGETTLSEHAASVGRKTRGGVEVRLLNIDADAGNGLGLFECIHGLGSADEFSRMLKQNARTYYGAPFRAFLQHLTNQLEGVVRYVREAQGLFLSRHVPDGSSGEITRAASRFALIGAAGMIATRWGLTGWEQTEATEMAERCFREWLAGRGGSGSVDSANALKQVRAFIETHGSSRFERWRSGGGQEKAEERPIPYRAGFVRTSSDGTIEFFVFKETFRNEVCSGMNPDRVLRDLDARALLIREDSALTVSKRLPGLGLMRVYGIRGSLLETEL